MDTLRNISSSVLLLEQKFSLSIEKRLDEAVEGIKAIQQRQERLENAFQLFRCEHAPAHPSQRTVSSSTPARPTQRTASSSTPVQHFQDRTNLIVIAESASATTPSAKLDLDISLLESSVLIKDEDGGDSENVVENDRNEIHITKEEVFHLSRASASRKNFAANLVRKIFTVEERASSNVKGVLGKQKLDPQRSSYVQKETFRMFPLESEESQLGVLVWELLMKPIGG